MPFFCVLQVWVYGNSFKSSLVAIVVPKVDAIKEWAKSKGKTGGLHTLPLYLCCYGTLVQGHEVVNISGSGSFEDLLPSRHGRACSR